MNNMYAHSVLKKKAAYISQRGQSGSLFLNIVREAIRDYLTTEKRGVNNEKYTW